MSSLSTIAERQQQCVRRSENTDENSLKVGKDSDALPFRKAPFPSAPKSRSRRAASFSSDCSSVVSGTSDKENGFGQACPAAVARVPFGPAHVTVDPSLADEYFIVEDSATPTPSHTSEPGTPQFELFQITEYRAPSLSETLFNMHLDGSPPVSASAVRSGVLQPAGLPPRPRQHSVPNVNTTVPSSRSVEVNVSELPKEKKIVTLSCPAKKISLLKKGRDAPLENAQTSAHTTTSTRP